MTNLHYTAKGQTITLSSDQGALILTVLTDQIIRVFQDRGRHTNSYAIEGEKKVETPFDLKEVNDHLELSTGQLTVKVGSDLFLDVFDAQGNPLILDYRGKRRPITKTIDAAHQSIMRAEGHEVSSVSQTEDHYYQVVKALDPDEQFYGLGDKTGYLNKRSYQYDNWNYDEPRPHIETFTNLYKSVPVLFGLKKGHPWGIFFDNTYRSHLDLGRERADYYFYSAVDGNLDYYILGGSSLKEVVSNYTYLTGRVPLPQRWMLGYQQSRWGYSMSQDRVKQIVDTFAKYHLPLEAVHFDIDYMDGYRIFTWNKNIFKDPAGFLADMKKRGVRVIPILDPGVKEDPDYLIYQEGLDKGYFATNPDGSVYVNKVWPGKSVFPDFGRPEVRDWWAGHCRFLVDSGAAGIWTDMNEPAVFDGKIPEDTVFSDEDQKSDLARINNVYGHNMAKATYQGLKKATGRRPYVITRAAYAGTQKYATVWTGDNQSLWLHLQMSIPQLCNMGMSGFCFAGADIGGFSADTTPELLTRWVEAAIFSPLLRNHSALQARDQEPWVFGPEVLDIYRHFLHLRYRFIPYLYDCFAKQMKEGLPVMRPLVLNYPEDARTRNLNDEYMVGDQVLVAPVVEQGQASRMVYLPKGDWMDLRTMVTFGGHRDILVEAPLDQLPIFVRTDSVLPWGRLVEHMDDQPEESMTFRLFGQHGDYTHYQDDGYSFDYEQGAYNLYQIHMENQGQCSVTVTHHGFKPLYRRIHLVLPERTMILSLDDKSRAPVYKETEA